MEQFSFLFFKQEGLICVRKRNRKNGMVNIMRKCRKGFAEGNDDRIDTEMFRGNTKNLTNLLCSKVQCKIKVQ